MDILLRFVILVVPFYLTLCSYLHINSTIFQFRISSLNSAIDITEDYFAGWSNAVINRNLVKVTKSGNLVNASVFITVNKQIDILTVCNIKEKYLPADTLYIWNPLIENASGYPYIGMVQINKPEKAIELRSSNKSTTLGVLFSLCYIIG